MIIFTSIVVVWRHMRYELTADREQQVCIPRDKFTLRGSKEDCSNGLRENFDKERNSTMCCGDASLVFSELASKVISEYLYRLGILSSLMNLSCTYYRYLFNNIIFTNSR